jgi:protein-S-isoprenylcysteine O-methyltransferase Ste14
LADPGDYNRIHVRKDKTNTRRLAYLTILLFASPPGWPWFAAGIVLVVLGVTLHGWAAGYLARAGYAERAKILTVRGPYRHSRNPYYLAQMTMDLGFFFLAGWPLLYLFYFPIIFFIYRRWVVNEESFLESEFGEQYLNFKREVPRWSFQAKPAPARGSELRFKWATFMINRELPRSLSHIFFLAVLVFFFYFSNSFSQLSALFRITLIAAIAMWLVLRDIYAVDVSQKSIGWFMIALCSIAAAALFLIYAPVWQPWEGPGAWVSIGVGLGFALAVWLAALPRIGGVSSKSDKLVFARPISQWYLLALSLGLLSCTPGGVWLGIMVPFTIWALHLASGVAIPTVPRQLGVSLALLALIVCSGGLAVARQLSD